MKPQTFAEGIGTFVLVLAGVGSAVLAGEAIGAAGVAFAFGLALLMMVYVIGPISGCHINPAVTVGLLLSGKMERRDAPRYIAAQLAGAIAASLVVLLIAKGGPDGYEASVNGLAANGYGAYSPGGFGMGAAFLTEVVLTFLLVLTVLGATDVRAPVGFAGVAIGFALVVVHLVGIPVTNTSVNPARSIGPALFVGGAALAQLWLFILAPLLGACLAAVCYRYGIGVQAPVLRTTEAEQALPEEQAQREDRRIA